MVFSSILFLFKFLPAALLVYYIAPAKFKNAVLLLCSLIFYSWGEVKYFPLMAATILVNYYVARGIGRAKKKGVRRLLFGTALFWSTGMLLLFKYTDFFIGNLNAFGADIKTLNLVLPLGISFYTFQILAYTIDVYRGQLEPERNIIDFGAFVVMFPQLIAGPIVNYKDVSRELKERRLDIGKITDGVRDFVIGAAKKVLIANNIGALWTQLETVGFENISSPAAWLGAVAFSLQLYFDFSGYSMMAIGIGKMLGFDFPKNFDFPYISKSITEFWRRWHITLSSWFRDYVYIPLGGSRKGKARTYLNLFIVWALTGFWHGASWNFVIWGLFLFLFLVIEKAGFLRLLEKGKIWPHIYTLLLAAISWSVFAITDIGELGGFLAKLFSFEGGSDAIYYLRNYGVTFAVAIVCSTPLVDRLYRKIKKSVVLDTAVLVMIFGLCVAYLVDESYNPFLYFRF